MIVDSPNLNALWADLLVEELVRCGVRHFVISPGSRSTPLALAAAGHCDANVCVHFDERGAAFHALGIGKASRIPAAFICTSGTAVANALPAAVEADACGVPLILLTADRPPDRIDTGANQTIRQRALFGDFARWRHDLPAPGSAVPPAALLTAVDQAVYRASGHDAGPVHLNAPFREPLAPRPEPFDRETWLAPVSAWLRTRTPYTRYVPRGAGPGSVDWLDALRNTRRGIVLVGLLDDPRERECAAEIAATLGWPVFPDPASGLRFTKGTGNAAHFFDAVTTANPAALVGTETVLHLGGPMTSKALNAWLGRAPIDHYLRVHPSPRRLDPVQRVSTRIQADLAGFSLVLADGLHEPNTDSAWSTRVLEASRAAGRTLDKAFSAQDALSEQGAVRTAVKAAPKRGALFLGNSLAIRHADHFAPATARCTHVFANRGASGIDGNIATAAGIARVLGMPVTAVIGDLAALHDLNSLVLLADPEVHVVLVVLNNDGGGIFHMLPIADYPERFEQLFGTPHGRGFDRSAKMFGIAHAAPNTRNDFEAALKTALQSGQSALIEVKTDREETAQLTRELRKRLEEA